MNLIKSESHSYLFLEAIVIHINPIDIIDVLRT